jgi:hypothetical protein
MKLGKGVNWRRIWLNAASKHRLQVLFSRAGVRIFLPFYQKGETVWLKNKG